MNPQIAIPVTDASQIGEARRAAAKVSDQAGLDTTHAGKVAIIVTELATNLVRYASRGRILLRGDTGNSKSGSVEILAIDSGPGFNAGRGMLDGYSTGGTPGNGLGAVQRLASFFDIYSVSPSGTVVMARVANGENGASHAGIKYSYGCVSAAAPHESVCGDAWSFSSSNGTASLMIADGLGHGPDAAAAAVCASSVFEKNPFVEVDRFIELSHQAMAGTRGAAVAIATMDLASAKLQFAGVGNIAGTIISPGSRQGLASHNGIVGAKLPRVKIFDYPLPSAGIVIMHSDGLQSRWTLDAYPGLPVRHPAIIAAVLHRDYYRDRDDVTVCTVSWHGGAT